MSATDRRCGRWPVVWGAGLALGVLALGVGAGCSARQHGRAADRDAYRIIGQAEQRLFGKTNAFAIETAYSGRKPDTIRASELIESRQTGARRVLSLPDALVLAVQHSREYQSQKEQLYLAALNLTGTRHGFAPNLFATSAGELAGVQRVDQGTLHSQAGFRPWDVLKSGGSIGLTIANDLLRYYTGSAGSGDPLKTAISTLSVNLVQPVLRGFGRNSPEVEALTQAERNVIYAVRSFTLYQNEFAVGVVNDYFGLLGQKDVIRNNYTNYLRRVETTRYLEARSVDRERQSAVDDARTAELGARISYINSVVAYENQLAAFKIRLGLPVTEVLYLEDAALRQLAQAGLMPVSITRDAGFHLAVERHMNVLNSIDRFEDRKRKVRVMADQLGIGLNLLASARLRSDAPTDYAKFDVDQIQWTAGFELDLPIDRLRERNEYRATLLDFESEVRALTLTLDNAQDQIDRGLRTLEQQRLNYLNRQAELEVARRRVNMNQILLEAGRVEIRDLRESQDALIAAQNQVTATLVDHLQARLGLLLDLGVLAADRSNFWLHDPLSERTADTAPATPAPPLPASDALVPPDQFLEPAS